MFSSDSRIASLHAIYPFNSIDEKGCYKDPHVQRNSRTSLWKGSKRTRISGPGVKKTAKNWKKEEGTFIAVLVYLSLL